jgi:hypothetical protein
MCKHDENHGQRTKALNIGSVRIRRCHPDRASSSPPTRDQPEPVGTQLLDDSRLSLDSFARVALLFSPSPVQGLERLSLSSTAFATSPLAMSCPLGLTAIYSSSLSSMTAGGRQGFRRVRVIRSTSQWSKATQPSVKDTLLSRADLVVGDEVSDAWRDVAALVGK